MLRCHQRVLILHGAHPFFGPSEWAGEPVFITLSILVIFMLLPSSSARDYGHVVGDISSGTVSGKEKSPTRA